MSFQSVNPADGNTLGEYDAFSDADLEAVLDEEGISYAELLDNCSIEEIRDLIAYIMSGGNPEDKRFK